MAKRVATRELTDRNWDVEEEPEEAGVFSKASEDILKQRQIKKAKRREVGENGGSSGIFAGFSGFNSKPSFTSRFGLVSLDSVKAKTQTLFSGSTTADTGQTANGSTEKKGPDYLQNLKSLNESVLAWIKQHVDKNPYCILTPIFKDYALHLEEIEKNEVENGSTSTKSDLKKGESTKKDSEDSEDKGSKTDEKEVTAQPTAGFKFPTSFSSTASADGASSGAFGSVGGSSGSSGSSFGNSSGKPAVFSGFNFKTSTSDLKPTFSFATESSSVSASQNQESGGDEEYVPPVPETQEVKEEGSVYSKRCKLFYQKDGKWVDRGVGNLHLKPVGEKLQLIVRADTNLGNIMLNIFLSTAINVKKQGKNNVFFVCIPNPPLDPKSDSSKPVPMLMRVKTSDDADEVIAKIEELRQ